MADKNIPTLSVYEMHGTEDIHLYSEALRDHSRSVAQEIDFTGAELQVRLSRAGMSLSDKLTARLKARKVTRRLRRARDLYNGAALEAVKFWAVYTQEYDTMLRPSKGQPGDKWHWNA